MTSPSSPVPPARDHASPSGFRVKLPPERVALLREWVECTTRPFKKIGQELGISPATISRYAKEGGWKRPDGAAPPPPAIARRSSAPARRPNDAPPSEPPRPPRRSAASAHPRENIVERLWSLADRHAEILETQPIERAERSLQTLARLTRTLGEIDRHARPSPPAADAPVYEYEIDAPKPRRSLHELRDELAAHLERINREEGDGWEIREWWFMNGEGI
ncbi:hypothetical protein [Microvirga lotononidis]|uniref:Uncharacterized protein n=1 Tax=Microvirga lotononidis TaxID=864069 RepID=I4YPX3_9HYPH|nr:hypothetical protein [Microvirga lotononidis]EIM26015.1 hypothetical protein MicloDRAFT_00067450 [Microvirga lotononidis]WQO25923.1 hypothetical protein U0023_14530 [Microvirga lotononidis]